MTSDTPTLALPAAPARPRDSPASERLTRLVDEFAVAVLERDAPDESDDELIREHFLLTAIAELEERYVPPPPVPVISEERVDAGYQEFKRRWITGPEEDVDLGQDWDFGNPVYVKDIIRDVLTAAFATMEAERGDH